MPVGHPLHDDVKCSDPEWGDWGYTSYPVSWGRICSKCAGWELLETILLRPRG